MHNYGIDVYWLEMWHDFIWDIGNYVVHGRDSCDGVVVVNDKEVSVCCCWYFVGRLPIRILRCFERYCYIMSSCHSVYIFIVSRWYDSNKIIFLKVCSLHATMKKVK